MSDMPNTDRVARDIREMQRRIVANTTALVTTEEQNIDPDELRSRAHELADGPLGLLYLRSAANDWRTAYAIIALYPSGGLARQSEYADNYPSDTANIDNPTLDQQIVAAANNVLTTIATETVNDLIDELSDAWNMAL